MKRLISVFLAVMILFSGTITYAKPSSPAYPEYEMYVATATNRLNELGALIAEQSAGQYGLIYRINILSEYAMYLEYLETYKDELKVSDSVIKSYKKILKQQLVLFNSRFSGKSTKYKSMKFTENTDKGNISSIYKSAVEYVKALFEDVNSKCTGKTESEIRGEYGVLLGVLYETVESLGSIPGDISNITPYSSGKTHKKYDPGIESTLEGIKHSFQTLYSIGEDASGASGVTELLTIDMGVEDYLENLADVVSVDGELQIPLDPKLSLAFHAIFASSSVYTPLRSYTGDSEFIAALKSISMDSAVSDSLELFYNYTKDYKKPLYYRKLDDKGLATGAAKLLTIEEFFQYVRDGASGSLCTVGGEFGYDVSTDSWLYTQENSNADLSDPGSEQVIDGTTDTNDSSTLSATPVASAADNFNWLADIFGFSVVHATNSNFTIPDQTSTESAENPASNSAPSSSTAITAEGEDDDKKNKSLQIPANSTITDSDKLTEPVLMFGAQYRREIDNITMVLLTNILQDTKNQGVLPDISSRYLYLNAYGDIVTDDNLVIFPGAANPLYFTDVGGGYNPFTVAFMNTYPTTMYVTEKFQLVTKNDTGKYLLILDENDESVYYAATTTAIDMIKESSPLKCGSIVTGFSANAGEDAKTVFEPIRLIFGSETNWDSENGLFTYKPLVNTASLTVNSDSVFPYDVDTDSNFDAAKVIAANMYNYLTYDSKSSVNKNLGKLYDNYMLHFVAMAGLDGAVDTEGYSNELKLKYFEFFKDSAKRRVNTLVDVSQSLFIHLTDVDGVVGLRNSYQDEILGNILTAVRTHYIIFLALFVLVLLFAFAKMHRDLFQSTLIFISSLGIAYCFVVLVPVYIPMLFNIVINNVSENLTYEVLGTKTEYYDASDSSMIALDDDGKYRFNTTSLTLYRSSAHKLEEFESSLNVDASELNGGNIVIVNQESGLFAEGDSLKINTDVLFSTLKIVSELDENSGVHHVNSYKTVSNNVDYYTPYYSIVDSFCNKLNSLANVYFIPKQAATYVNGTSKINYLVYSYVHSAPFLMPGEYNNNIARDTEAMDDDEKEEYNQKAEAITQKLEESFGTNDDWLGISDFLYNPSEAMKATLWLQTLQDNKFYTPDWEVNEERMCVLIGYVNRITRKFVFDLEDQVGVLSDDVMIKLIATRALVAFNQKASQLGRWLYPYSLNYEELSLGDILNCVFTDDYELYTQMNMNVVSYVESKFGWFNLVVFDVLVVVMFLTIHVIRLLVPIMYLLLGVLLVIKLMSNGDLKLPLKGYFRGTVIVMFSSTIMCFGVLVCKRMAGNPVAIYFMLFLMLAVLWLLGKMVSAVVSNVTDFGAAVKLTDVLTNKVFNFSPHKNVNVNSTIVGDERRRNNQGYGRRRNVRDMQYDMDAPMGYIYGSQRRRRPPEGHASQDDPGQRNQSSTQGGTTVDTLVDPTENADTDRMYSETSGSNEVDFL